MIKDYDEVTPEQARDLLNKYRPYLHQTVNRVDITCDGLIDSRIFRIYFRCRTTMMYRDFVFDRRNTSRYYSWLQKVWDVQIADLVDSYRSLPSLVRYNLVEGGFKLSVGDNRIGPVRTAPYQEIEDLLKDLDNAEEQRKIALKKLDDLLGL